MLLFSPDRRADAVGQRLHLEAVDRLTGAYHADLERRVRALHEETVRALRGRVRADADEDPLGLTAGDRAALVGLLGRIARAWKSDQKPDPRDLDRLFSRADRATTQHTRRAVATTVRGRGVERLLLDAPAVDPKAMRANFIASNVELVTSIDTRYLADVAGLVDIAARDGRAWPWLARSLDERFGVSRTRAQLIARDQLGKLSGQLTQVRHLELGLDSYQWMTSADERVRRSHERLEGRIFRWDAPPPVGHPGEDFQCRCTSRAVVSAAHAEQLRAQAEARMRGQAERIANTPIVLGTITARQGRRLDPSRIAEFRGEFRRVA